MLRINARLRLFAWWYFFTGSAFIDRGSPLGMEGGDRDEGFRLCRIDSEHHSQGRITHERSVGGAEPHGERGLSPVIRARLGGGPVASSRPSGCIMRVAIAFNRLRQAILDRPKWTIFEPRSADAWPRSAVPGADARHRHLVTWQFQRQPYQPRADEAALLFGSAAVEDSAKHDVVGLATAGDDSEAAAALVMRTGAFSELHRPLARPSDRQLVSGPGEWRGDEGERGEADEGNSQREGQCHTLGSRRGIAAFARYCSPASRTTVLSLTKSRTQTVPSATWNRVEASQRSTTSQVVPRTVAEP